MCFLWNFTGMDADNHEWTLVQVMAWCRQATSLCLSQCWSSVMSPCGVTRPQWVKAITGHVSCLTDSPTANRLGLCSSLEHGSSYSLSLQAMYWLNFRSWSGPWEPIGGFVIAFMLWGCTAVDPIYRDWGMFQQHLRARKSGSSYIFSSQQTTHLPVFG